MLTSMKLSKASNAHGTRHAVAAPAVRPVHTRTGKAVAVSCKATAWDSWTGYIQKHRAESEGAKTTRAESAHNKELAAAVAKAASSFKPKYAGSSGGNGNGSAPGAATDFHLSHMGAVNVNDLPRDLHERLEAIACLQLKEGLGLSEQELDAASISFTTTDVDAALCVSGVTLQQGLDKTAYVAVVATETERQASWSRLEGLILHWGCSDAAGGAWGLPPQGWAASPNKVTDAGGAWQCAFEKTMLGNSATYLCLLKLPLRGILKSGGIVFVLKATAGQNTRWLKDEDTKKDFFVDLTRLPVVKA